MFLKVLLIIILIPIALLALVFTACLAIGVVKAIFKPRARLK